MFRAVYNYKSSPHTDPPGPHHNIHHLLRNPPQSKTGAQISR